MEEEWRQVEVWAEVEAEVLEKDMAAEVWEVDTVEGSLDMAEQNPEATELDTVVMTRPMAHKHPDMVLLRVNMELAEVSEPEEVPEDTEDLEVEVAELAGSEPRKEVVLNPRERERILLSSPNPMIPRK